MPRDDVGNEVETDEYKKNESKFRTNIMGRRHDAGHSRAGKYTVVDSSLIGAVATVSNPQSATRSPGQSRVAFLLSTLGRLLSLPLISIIVSALSKLTR